MLKVVKIIYKNLSTLLVAKDSSTFRKNLSSLMSISLCLLEIAAVRTRSLGTPQAKTMETTLVWMWAGPVSQPNAWKVSIALEEHIRRIVTVLLKCCFPLVTDILLKRKHRSHKATSQGKFTLSTLRRIHVWLLRLIVESSSERRLNARNHFKSATSVRKQAFWPSIWTNLKTTKAMLSQASKDHLYDRHGNVTMKHPAKLL